MCETVNVTVAESKIVMWRIPGDNAGWMPGKFRKKSSFQPDRRLLMGAKNP